MTESISSSFIAPPSVFITPWSAETAWGSQISNVSGFALGSAANPTAQRVFYVPFTLRTGVTVYRFFWANGTTASTDTVQVGVYDDQYNSVVLGTGTTATGASVPQFDNVTDFSLPRGRYFMALVCSGTTTHFLRSANAAAVARMTGVVQQAGQATLPATMVPAQLASAYVPLFGLALRASP